MFSTRPSLLFCTAVGLLLAPALAANATAMSSSGCVDPSGFASCLESATMQAATCIAEAGGNDYLVIGCGWEQDVNNLLCYMSGCWNKVYSCEYQYLASSYLIARGKETIPFYPAPQDAPGGCSCNMGNVLQNATASIELIQSKCSSYEFSSTTSLAEFSLANKYSHKRRCSFYGICPTTEPSQLGLDKLASEVKAYTSFTGSCSNLDATTCLGGFNIGSADNGTYVNPASLPAGGTELLSTTTGVGYPLTSPPGGWTMTVTLLSDAHTVTAASYNAKNVVTETASTSSSTSSSSSSSSSSGSGSNANPLTGNSGHSGFITPSINIYIGILFVAVLTWL
ncbi:uncharacterized protein N7482_001667 [Penicillium canariense]|uniref:Uncharacterized protein n=1 Tax=Penicillium canariense TaxID=189055 RepID=A0A9W9LTS6_9EURO|nr:uncharacterized protein N7482_001667 [Penicillium canariense]KAJ5175790.1 hypothetical protein N7482_001667 [Penicillium canariense]